MKHDGMKDNGVARSKPETNRKMAIPKATLVLLAQSDQRWTSLQRLLRTIPQVEALYWFTDPAALLGRAATLSPALLLLDLTTPNAALLVALPQIQSGWPQTRTLALVADEVQGRLAEATGIQFVLPEGVLAATLWETIEALLLEEGADSVNPPEANK